MRCAMPSIDPFQHSQLHAQGHEIDYLVDCVYHPSTERLYVVAGSHAGCLEILHVNQDSITPALLLEGGHSSTVRSMDWDPVAETIVTGGEDSYMTLWTATAPPEGESPRKEAKMTTSSSGSSAAAAARKKANPY
eukprot:m.23170 g.23170  ORF g.23170 m.23170 type:complete len:135 (-) comp4071_c0_seq1:142-546(-)